MVMKKLLLLFVLSGLLSCSNDDPAPVPQEILGKWKYVEYVTDYLEYDQNGNIIHYYITDGFEVQFNSDGSFTSNEVDGFSGGYYSVNNNIIQMNYLNGSTFATKFRRYYSSSDSQLYLSPQTDIQLTDEMVHFDNYIMSKL